MDYVMLERDEYDLPAEPFTPAEANFWAVLNEADDLSQFYPDEPEVNYIPRARWRQAMWQAVQAIRREDAARGGWPSSIHQEGLHDAAS
jgi:hypothetical protein